MAGVNAGDVRFWSSTDDSVYPGCSAVKVGQLLIDGFRRRHFPDSEDNAQVVAAMLCGARGLTYAVDDGILVPHNAFERSDRLYGPDVHHHGSGNGSRFYSGYLQHHQIGPTTCACFAVAILCGGICWLVWIMPSIGTNDVHFVINLIVGVLVGGYALAYGAIMWDRRALRVIDGDATYGGSWLFGQKVGPYRLWSRSSALVWFVILAVVVVMVQFNFAPFEAGAFYETAKIIGIGLFLLIVASELPGKYRLHSHYGPIVIFVLGHTAIAAVLTMILAPEPISHLLAPSPALSTIGFVFIAAYAAILLGQTWEKRLAAAREVTTVKPLPADAP